MRLGSGASVRRSPRTTPRPSRPSARRSAAVAPTVRGGAQVMFGNSNWATSIQGTTPDYLTIRDLSVAQAARSPIRTWIRRPRWRCWARPSLQNLFGDSDPVGQVIRIKNVPFTVIGVLAPKGQSPSGQDQDDVILHPDFDGQAGRPRRRAAPTPARWARSWCRPPAPNLMDEAQTEIGALLRQRHRLQPGQDDDFTVRNLSEVFDAQESSARVMSLLLGAIASRLADRRRDRDHEHHAGLGDRAHARDRPAAGGGGQDARHPVAIPGGGGDAFGAGRDRSGFCSGWVPPA